MGNELKPKRYYQDIYSINYDLLLEEDIKYLLVDLDNTIADSRYKYPSEKAINLFNELHEKGFQTIIFTNALPHRAIRFATALDSEVYYLAGKPRRHIYLKLLATKGIEPEMVAAIGDQIYTDIKGANRLNIFSILVDRISKYESILSKPNRIKEKYLVYKKGIIRKGEYYE